MILVEPQHGVARLEIGLHRDRILRGGELRAAEERSEPAGLAFRLLDHEFAPGRVHRGRDGEIVYPGDDGRQKDEHGESRHEHQEVAAAAADDVLLHPHDFLGTLRFAVSRLRRQLLRGADGLGQLDPAAVRIILGSLPHEGKGRRGGVEGIDALLAKKEHGLEFVGGLDAVAQRHAPGGAQLPAGQSFGADRGKLVPACRLRRVVRPPGILGRTEIPGKTVIARIGGKRHALRRRLGRGPARGWRLLRRGAPDTELAGFRRRSHTSVSLLRVSRTYRASHPARQPPDGRTSRSSRAGAKRSLRWTF